MPRERVPNLGDHRQTRFSQYRGISSATQFRMR